MKRCLSLLMLVAIAVLAVGAFIPPGDAEAGRGKRGNRSTLTEGIDKHGNDILRVTHQGSKRFRSSAGQHFGMEELLYGPGDQGRIWHRPRGERLNDRSGSGSGYGDEGQGIGRGRRGYRYSESESEYGYDGCDMSGYGNGYGGSW